MITICSYDNCKSFVNSHHEYFDVLSCAKMTKNCFDSERLNLFCKINYVGSANSNERESQNCLSRDVNFKLGCFATEQFK